MAVGRYGTPEAVVLDTSPVVNYLLRQQQEKRLMQQQLDRQVNDDLTKLSFDGARSQDFPAIRQAYDSFRNAAIQYKRALRDPKTRDSAEQNYLNSKAQMNTIISQSKERKELAKQVYSFYGKNRADINEDEFQKNMAMVNAPWGTPEFEQGRDFDISKITFKPEQFQADKWQPVINSVKPSEVTSSRELPTGQILTSKRRVIDPNLFSQTVEGLYNSDLGHGKKYWDNKFKAMQPEDKSVFEDYMNKYIPGFEIKEPKDLAVASYAYGRLEQDLGDELKGTNRSRIEAFQREMQNRIDDRLDKRIAALAKKDADKNYYVIDDIANAFNSGNGPAAIAPLKAEATQGTIIRHINSTSYKDGSALDRALKELKKDGIDYDTRAITKEQLKNGVIVVGVPKIDPKTKEVIKGSYDYMAVPRGDKALAPRINALLNYAKGADAKLLPQQYYKNRIQTGPTQAEVIISNQLYGPAQLDPQDDEDEN